MAAEAINTRVIVEGNTSLVVPEDAEPAKYPSFFNAHGKFVRDVSLVCYGAYSKSVTELRQQLTFADCLCGTGARGIRVANELGCYFGKVFLNDVSATSIALAKQSARINNVVDRCFLSNEEANKFLLSRTENECERFDLVDVDPFGTPSPFVDCALRSIKHGGLLSVSATDTAVLCGVYPKVAQRKYLGLPLRTEYSHEIGMRLIFGLLSINAMRLESSIRPLFCHHDMHYFRTFCLVEIGNNYSRENEKQIGYVLHCFKCSFREVISRDEFLSQADKSIKCSNCGTLMKVGGPMWIGDIQSKDFVEKCAETSQLPVFQRELDIPLYYDLSEISDFLQVRTPRIADVIKELESIGHSASRTRLNRTAVRTDAPLPEVQKVLAQLSR